MEDVEEEEYSGGKDPIFDSCFMYLSGDAGDDIPEADEPSNPVAPKRSRHSRACDFCRKKKVYLGSHDYIY
jgi:hypothetical protein